MDIKVKVEEDEAIEDWAAFREAIQDVADRFDVHLGTIWHVGSAEL